MDGFHFSLLSQQHSVNSVSVNIINILFLNNEKEFCVNNFAKNETLC